MNNDLEEIKRRLNVVDVIQDYVKLEKSGANFRARCPFHSEKTPSFFVSPEKQIWHCFGSCGIGGDMFRFIMEIEGVEFRQALEILANRAGVQLERFNPQAENTKSTLFAINEIAAHFFQKALTSTSGGKKALDYLKGRSLNSASLEEFHLGYAPSSWRALNSFLIKKGFSEKDIVASGLALKNEKGRLYDRFRARIMFPVFSATGQIAGFSGRTLLEDPKEAKYVNTPQTLIYDKSRELYGLYQAKPAIRQNDSALIMEGNIDVVLSHQAGLKQAIATCGTALTGGHLQTISRYTKNLILAFDNDEAGRKACFRAFELAQVKEFHLYTLQLGREKDPADVISKNGNSAWEEIVKNPLHFMDYVWEAVSAQYPLSSVDGKSRAVKVIFHLLSFFSSEVERSHWLAEFAKRLDVREDALFHDFQKFEEVDEGAINRYNIHDTPDPLEGRGTRNSFKKDRLFQDKENLVALLSLYPSFASDIPKDLEKTITKDVTQFVSRDELVLKAEVFWPNEHSAKREFQRILSHMVFAKRKKDLLASLKKNHDQRTG